MRYYFFTTSQQLPIVLREGLSSEDVLKAHSSGEMECRLTVEIPKNELASLHEFDGGFVYTSPDGIPSSWITQVERLTPQKKYQRLGLNEMIKCLKGESF